MPKLTGECLCGQVKYTLNQDFYWLKGEQLVSRYDGLPHVIKTFCKRCGSNLISYMKDNQELIGLPLDGINEDPGKQPEYHIFVDYKAPWHKITDDLPQYSKLPEDPIVIHKLNDS